MDTFVLILRILLLVIGSLIAIVYFLFQFYQKVQPFSLNLSTADYIVCAALALLFGFGTNSYYGLFSFVPLLFFKYLCRYFFKPKFLSGSGRWIEVNWKKLMPKGFEKILPKTMLTEMDRMPKDAHFVIPKLYFGVAVYFIRKKMLGEVSKGQGPMKISAAQQNMALGQFTSIIESLTKLRTGQTERKDFPFGMLKVTRL